LAPPKSIPAWEPTLLWNQLHQLLNCRVEDRTQLAMNPKPRGWVLTAR